MSNTFRYLFLILRNKFLLDLLKIHLYFLQNHKFILKRRQLNSKIRERGQRSKSRCNGPEYTLCIFCAGRASTIRSVNPCTPAKPEDDVRRGSFYA